jgi:ABC-type multidrug transport system fused ATPase/permease subunit
MYDPEDSRIPPKTWREYLAQSKEMIGAIKWAWREFKTPETLHWYRHLIAAIIVATIFSASQAKLFATFVNGTSKHDLWLTITGTCGFFLCLIIQRLADAWHGTAREELLGLNMGELDHVMSKRFFEKSIGQHVEENYRLNPDSIMTGRERLLGTQGILLFEGIPTFVGLSFSYILLWIFLGPIVGMMLTVSISCYTLYLLYLNQKVLENCTPIEIGWRALKRYRVERMKNIERVKTSAKENDELAVMKDQFIALLKRELKFWLWYIKHTFWRGLIMIVGLMAAVVYGIRQVWVGHWLIGALIPLVVWSLEIVNNMWRVGHIERELNWFMPAVRHMIEALSIAPAITSKPDAFVISKGEPVEVAFEAITHTYPLDSDDQEDDDAGEREKSSSAVLKNVSFTIKSGERVALIGPSGAGKTTLMKLLLRFMDPDQGSVKVNGYDLRDVDHPSWMRATAYIPQHAQILDGTIRYNLKYGLSAQENDQWDDERLWKLMRKLRIDFGKRLNRGLNTLVGEQGLKLSGGQAQRVMIGAAAIQHPPFMVIDEAMSNLDSATERAVHDGFMEILGDDVGALIIAHRLSSVRDICRRFVVLRNAEEVKDGESQIEAIANSFEELYDLSPTFRRLADAQNVAIRQNSITVPA